MTYPMVRPAEVHPTRRATWRLMRFVSTLARFVPMDAMDGICGVPAAAAWPIHHQKEDRIEARMALT